MGILMGISLGKTSPFFLPTFPLSYGEGKWEKEAGKPRWEKLMGKRSGKNHSVLAPLLGAAVFLPRVVGDGVRANRAPMTRAPARLKAAE